MVKHPLKLVLLVIGHTENLTLLSFALTTIGFPAFRFPDALPGGEVTMRYKQSFLRFMYRSIERAIREYSVFCFVFSAIHDLISAPKSGLLMYDKTFFMD